MTSVWSYSDLHDSIFGPTLFTFYRLQYQSAPVIQHHVSLCCYVDDTQTPSTRTWWLRKPRCCFRVSAMLTTGWHSFTLELASNHHMKNNLQSYFFEKPTTSKVQVGRPRPCLTVWPTTANDELRRRLLRFLPGFSYDGPSFICDGPYCSVPKSS